MNGRTHTALAGIFVLALAPFFSSPARAEDPLVSRYLPEIHAVSHPSIAPPADPVLLRWDFSAGRELRYGFRQQMVTRLETSSSLGGESVCAQSAQGEGVFFLKGDGGGAEAVLKDYTVRKTVEPERGKPARTVEQAHPFQLLPSVTGDGSLRIWRDRDVTLGALFALPPRPLALGETVEVPVRVPFEAAGSLLEVEGRFRITLADFVEIAGRRCARLDAEIELSRTELPPGMGRFDYRARGASVLFFDLEERRLVSGSVALRMSSVAQTPVPSTMMDGRAFREEPEWSRVERESDTLIVVGEEI